MALLALKKIRWRRIETFHKKYYFGRIVKMYFHPKTLVMKGIEVLAVTKFRKFFVPSESLISSPRGLLIEDKYLHHITQKEEVDSVSLLSTSVYTESGNYLGNVVDLLFDTTSLALIQLDVEKRIFLWKSQSLLIHKNEILQVNKKMIVVKDSVLYAEKPLPLIMQRGLDISLMTASIGKKQKNFLKQE